MKKIILLLSIVIIVVSSCKKKDEVKPCPVIPAPQYSDTKYYLTNPSGRGELDTISFSLVAGTVDEYLITSLVGSFSNYAELEFNGPEMDIYYQANSSNTMFFEGSGMLGDNEMFIQWYSANIDTTGVQSFYSVYSKVRIN